MTVNTIGSIAEFVTNGVTTNYPFYFKFLANEDLVVTYVNPQGVSSTLTLGTNYTVNGVGNDNGGSIVTTTALAGPGQLVVSREMDPFQQTSLRNQGKFLAETHEDVFDKLTMLIQQGLAIVARALTRPLGRDYFFAESRRITSVKDPVDPQDAATKNSVESYVNGLIGTGQGPVNNAANVLYATPGGITRTVQSRLREVVAITDFTGAVEGAVNSSAAAFVAAEASVHQSIYLPFGVWNAGTTALSKRYYGLGKLITNGLYRGQEYTNLKTDPQRAETGDFSRAASADISKVNLLRFDMGRIRNNLDEYYYNSATTPYWADGIWLAGSSGTSSRFTNSLAVGATSLNLVAAVAEITPGMKIRITNDVISHAATCVTNAGSTLTFTPPLAQAMNVTYTEGPVPSYGYVSMAVRTMNQMWMGHVEHQGGGDAYVYGGRIIANNKARQTSQDHFFETQTVGLIGGDLIGIAHGSYMTGMELQFLDTNFSGSYQIAAVGLVYSFNRTADRAVDTFGCIWMGSLFKSEGSAFADVAYRAYGRWKRGIDFTGMEMQGDQAAIILQRKHRIYLDGTGVSKDPRGFSWYADTPGGTWIGTANDGSLSIAHNSVARIIADTAHTYIRSSTFNDTVVFDSGMIDLRYALTDNNTRTRVAYFPMKVNGTIYYLPLFQ